MDLERAPGLLVDLRDAMVRGGGTADMTPGIGVQSSPHRDTQAVDLQPAAIDEPRGLHRGRLDDRGLAGLVREPLRYWDVFELASSGSGRRGSAPGREREDEERGDRTFNAHVRSLSGPLQRRKEIRARGRRASIGARLDDDVRASEEPSILTAAEARRNGTSGDFPSSP